MGAFNAFTVVKLGITPLIATIAANYIYQGIVYYFTRSGAFYPEGDLRKELQEELEHVFWKNAEDHFGINV